MLPNEMSWAVRERGTQTVATNNLQRKDKKMPNTNLYERAARRVRDSKKLSPHAAFILSDWNEGDEHWNWVINAREDEILDWVEANK